MRGAAGAIARLSELFVQGALEAVEAALGGERR
jgi:hypothetical protein